MTSTSSSPIPLWAEFTAWSRCIADAQKRYATTSAVVDAVRQSPTFSLTTTTSPDATRGEKATTTTTNNTAANFDVFRASEWVLCCAAIDAEAVTWALASPSLDAFVYLYKHIARGALASRTSTAQRQQYLDAADLPQLFSDFKERSERMGEIISDNYDDVLEPLWFPYSSSSDQTSHNMALLVTLLCVLTPGVHPSVIRVIVEAKVSEATTRDDAETRRDVALRLITAWMDTGKLNELRLFVRTVVRPIFEVIWNGLRECVGAAPAAYPTPYVLDGAQADDRNARNEDETLRIVEAQKRRVRRAVPLSLMHARNVLQKETHLEVCQRRHMHTRFEEVHRLRQQYRARGLSSHPARRDQQQRKLSRPASPVRPPVVRFLSSSQMTRPQPTPSAASSENHPNNSTINYSPYSTMMHAASFRRMDSLLNCSTGLSQSRDQLTESFGAELNNNIDAMQNELQQPHSQQQHVPIRVLDSTALLGATPQQVVHVQNMDDPATAATPAPRPASAAPQSISNIATRSKSFARPSSATFTSTRRPRTARTDAHPVESMTLRRDARLHSDRDLAPTESGAAFLRGLRTVTRRPFSDYTLRPLTPIELQRIYDDDDTNNNAAVRDKRSYRPLSNTVNTFYQQNKSGVLGDTPAVLHSTWNAQSSSRRLCHEDHDSIRVTTGPMESTSKDRPCTAITSPSML
eukprot:PhM_4_TR17920/c0_g1_i1/m.68796